MQKKKKKKKKKEKKEEVRAARPLQVVAYVKTTSGFPGVSIVNDGWWW